MTSPSLTRAVDQFANPRGYLSVASMGLPPRATVEALTADLAAWVDGRHNPRDFDAIVERSRGYYASIVGVPVERVAQGSQTSVLTSLIAAEVPDGAEVLMPEGDFSSIQFPFVVLPSVRVRAVPAAELASSITDETWLVVFSLVQSATGVIADTEAILEAAQRHDAFTLCDVTQAAGVLPVDAGLFDVTVCHTYKWLCAPRGVAFLTLSERMDALLTPRQAGWYAGQEIWSSTYGPSMTLASTARRFDVSPAWTAWVGAEPALADDAAASKRAGVIQPQRPPRSIADGLLTSLGQHTWPVVRDLVPRIFTVEEDEIITAMRLFMERAKLVIEPSAAVPLAAVLSPEFRTLSDLQRVGIVLCGGNVDLSRLPF